MERPTATAVNELIMSDTSECQLLALPPELRNAIYGHALSVSKPIRVRYDTFDLCWAYIDEANPPCTPVLRTCRTINTEATALLYGSNHFQVVSPDLHNFLRQIAASARHIRHLEILQPINSFDEVGFHPCLAPLSSLETLCYSTHGNRWYFEAADLAVDWQRYLRAAVNLSKETKALKELCLKVDLGKIFFGVDDAEDVLVEIKKLLPAFSAAKRLKRIEPLLRCVPR